MGPARRTRLYLEQLEPRDLPSSSGFTSLPGPPTPALQKQITSELVMEFMVIVSSGPGSGLAQGILSSFGPVAGFPPSVALRSPLRDAPVRMTLAAGVALGGAPASMAPAVAQGGGGIVTTFDTPDLDDPDADDSLARTSDFSQDLALRVATPPAAPPPEILHKPERRADPQGAVQL